MGLPKIFGSVDPLGRPTVRIAVVGREDEVLATIDTGFNGEVMTTAGDAASIGVEILEDSERVELGDGNAIDVRLGRMTIDWLGRQRVVAVFVSGHTRSSSGGPALLIGTALLRPHLLLIDFGAETVEVETQH